MSSYDQMVALSRRYLTGLIGHDEFHREARKVIGQDALYAKWTWLAVAINNYAELVEGIKQSVVEPNPREVPEPDSLGG